MKLNHSARLVLLAGALASWSAPTSAQTAERLSDKDVKALLEQVDEGRDKFEGNLDGAFKSSTLRSATGEAKVSTVLQDYQDNTKKLKERFTADYAAGLEVAAVLKQSTAIDRFMQAAAASMKGRSEWDRQVVNVKRLAEVYGTVFPLADGATVRRMNDKETASAAAAIATAGDAYKKGIDKATALPKPDRDAAKKDAELLIKQANAVKSRINGGQPATGELRQLVEQSVKIQTFVGSHDMAAAATSWQAVQTSLGKLQQAFGPTK
jgi:hypothetical protein